MTFEADIKAHLQADATLVALVADRIYPVIRPQNAALPAVTYTAPAPDEVNTLAGRSDSLRNYRLQVDCWAESHAAVVAMANAVRSRMNTAASAFRAVLYPGTGLDDYESDTRLYRRMLEFSVWYTET